MSQRTVGRPMPWHERLALWVYGLGMRWARPLLMRKLARRAVTEAGYAHDVPARFGRYATPAIRATGQPGPPPGGPLIWVHAVSLGEARVAALLLTALRSRLPGMRVLLTHSTATGWAEGHHHVQPGDVQTWLPWDDPAAVQAFLTHFRPSVGVLMETEIWPQLVQGCVRQGIPLALANARLNDRSARQALKLAWLSRPAYAGLSAVWAQTAADAQRLQAVGAVVQGVWGNLKFDARPNPAQCAQARAWRRNLTQPVVMLASSRAGEELEMFEQIKAIALDQKAQTAPFFDVTQVQWLVVPRHPQRFDDVARLIESQGWICQRRADWGPPLGASTSPGPPAWAADARPQSGTAGTAGTAGTEAWPFQVWLGDSLGEMALYYSLADVALLGGSFEPLGGQNLIEAAACGCPLVLGPHTFNFAQASDEAVAAGAALRVADLRQGIQAALHWLAHDQERQTAAQAALAFAQSQQGATALTAQAIVSLLPADPQPLVSG